VHDDFTSGYCDTYVVTNHSALAVTWSKTIDLGGSLSQHWESLVDGQSGVQGVSGTVTFTGVMNNATLQPDGITRFGFCVMR
jgi:cellulase/cellobiase CelA1